MDFYTQPFLSSKPEHVENLKEKENAGEIMAAQYDIVLNGFEIGGGSVRAHDPEILKIFGILGHSEDKIQSNFSHVKSLGFWNAATRRNCLGI
ncbi:MAG: amino acid--tRNA ligase-related protein [Candidatus Paceibacterota bacterium]